MRQIRGSDFLERNPATGPSLFDLAALHQDAGSEDMEVLMGASAAQPGSADGMESVEDLARKLVLQVCLCPLLVDRRLVCPFLPDSLRCICPGSCAQGARGPWSSWEQVKELLFVRAPVCCWMPVTRRRGQLVASPFHPQANRDSGMRLGRFLASWMQDLSRARGQGCQWI
jgi:hypothetical protein